MVLPVVKLKRNMEKIYILEDIWSAIVVNGTSKDKE